MTQPVSKERKISRKLTIMLPIVLVITLFLWLVPTSFFGIEGLTVTEQRTIAIFVFAALMWMFEIIPTWTTSVLIIVIMLLTISDSSLSFMKGSGIPAEMGTFVSYKSIMATFADPVIMLFLGGFILAIASTKVGMDVQLARVLLKPFGKKSEFVLLGFLMVIGIFSMFMSNTATAAMMLTFLAPVLKTLPPDGKGRIALALAIPIAANLGGIGTPIGTPPNAIAFQYLNDSLHLDVGFGDWALRMIPYVLVMLFIAWLVLLKLYPFKQKTIELKIEGAHEKTWRTYVVWITFAVTILLWMTEQLTGLNSNVVAMIPVGVFCVTGIITKDDLKEINWSVLWMVAGGFALGLALTSTGLAEHLVTSIPFGEWLPIAVILVSGFIGYFISNFISNTAAASLIVPILCAVGVGMGETLDPLGGSKTLLIGAVLCTSLAMLFPISTPPNALAHSTGLVTTKDMTKVGIIIGIIGFILGYAMLFLIGF
ncbi:MAG: SLC13/DASS family transporter [Bacteroidetes bacterium]|uniref:SLC13/DASS family transporter n=1 Tax=Candidatus Cryptobacteroides excrementipullorum TaxID=2840761 RepID=A0A9D9NL28_9BACT|nr:SLC13/DASS family transporter [Candidatus Cryptobacteroides excrementipullorum]